MATILKALKSKDDAIPINIPRDRYGEFEPKVVKKYPSCVNFWQNNWANHSSYFKYPQEVRTIIYTTNTM